jgi:hypothetical protein
MSISPARDVRVNFRVSHYRHRAMASGCREDLPIAKFKNSARTVIAHSSPMPILSWHSNDYPTKPSGQASGGISNDAGAACGNLHLKSTNCSKDRLQVRLEFHPFY